MPNRPCKAGIRIKTEQKLKMPKRGRTAIQQSKREKAKVYFGECWTTPKKTLKRWKEWNRVKTLTRCWRCTQHTKNHNQTKNTRRRNHKKYQRISNNRKKKGRPKEDIWQKTSTPGETPSKITQITSNSSQDESKNQKTDIVWNKNRVRQKILQCS